MDEIAFQHEVSELVRWTKKFRRRNARRKGLDLCRMCGRLVKIGYVYCQECQMRIDGEDTP